MCSVHKAASEEKTSVMAASRSGVFLLSVGTQKIDHLFEGVTKQTVAQPGGALIDDPTVSVEENRF